MSDQAAAETITEVQVCRSAITEHRVVTVGVPKLADCEVLFAVDRFAVTANNVTYAAFGEFMKYWNFFPSSSDADVWGIVPVWGFGDVVASKAEGVAVGERFYGYFPMATHLVIQAAKVTPAGMFDGAAHRRDLSPVYNQYVRVANDPSYSMDLEGVQMLLRPLFTTSFLIDDFLADNNLFDATSAVLSSASSKTAYGAAFCLHQRGTVKVVGLTSERNRAFTESLGCYDQVLTYEEVALLDQEPTVYVDMSGSGSVRTAIHNHLGDMLTYDCAVGGTHWDAMAQGSGAPLPGPSPQLFFAPSQVQKRNADWGPAGFASRLADAWTLFLTNVVEAEKPWMTIEAVDGADAVASCFSAQVTGTASPEIGYVASVGAATASRTR
jgi:Protein of unknown function (DUF2855)